MVGIFQLILLVLKGIQFPKKTKDIRSHQKEKNTKSAHVFLTTYVEANKKLLVLECWMVGRDGDQTHAFTRSKATLQLGIVFDGQNFEMQTIATLHIGWGLGVLARPGCHTPTSLKNLLQTNHKETYTKPIPSIHVYIYIYGKYTCRGMGKAIHLLPRIYEYHPKLRKMGDRRQKHRFFLWFPDRSAILGSWVEK